MKFCGIFFGALVYNSAHSCLLRKIMRKTCFKANLWVKFRYSGIGNFGVWSLFLGIINEITWSVPELAFSHYYLYLLNLPFLLNRYIPHLICVIFVWTPIVELQLFFVYRSLCKIRNEKKKI